MAPFNKAMKKKPKQYEKKLQKPIGKAFKPKNKPNNAAVESQLVEDEVPDFPRGGGSSLSREELDEVRAEVDAEFEGEQRGLRKGKKKKPQKQSHSVDDDLGSLFGGGISGKLPRFANKITWKNISPGMKLWGVVAEINEKDIVISLPGGLRGLVRASEAYDDISENTAKDVESILLSSMYHVNQLVSCIVLKLDDDKKDKGKPKIWLSLRLSLLHKSLSLDVVQEGMVLSAYVKSIEDHGYILYFGQSSFAGFMEKTTKPENKEAGVNTGNLLQGIVKSIDRTRKVVYLSSDPDVVSKSVTKELKGISIDLLVPGMMINARVQTTLENGILLSFLIYFTGTVDLFHLQKTFPSSNWKDEYLQNKKVNARILFIDPLTRAVGLTLNPHLVQNKAPPSLTRTGDIFDDSKVIRVDRGMGLLLEIPTVPIPTPAYVIVSDVADKEVKQLEKNFREGSKVRARILGFKHMEGIATSTLKTSAFEGSVFTHSDVKPGMVVKAKIIAVDNLRAIVQFPSGVKALCPLRHMSEYETTKPRKKFQIGADLQFRVLGCKSKRITVTHKKTLVKSKLAIISSYADATEGLITHGWITKIESHGCFVHFYNGVQGFAPRSELGLELGCDPSSVYHVEEVVKCRVTGSAAASRRINLSFVMKPRRVNDDETVKLGSIVSGAVEQVTPRGIIVRVNAEGKTVGIIPPEHLSDHQGLAGTMKSVLKPGFSFDELLVLDTENSMLILSAKYSLVNSAQKLPSEASQIQHGTVLHGYVCNLIESGCFVRYLGRFTGFVPRSKAMDDRKANFLDSFYIGQSVRSKILDVCKESGRVTSSLKQSLCSSTDASFMQEYFLTEDRIARLQLLDPKTPVLDWVGDFNFGSRVEGKVSEVKDSGVGISFEKHPEVVGFITHYQLGGAAVKVGAIIQAVVLDAVKTEGLVELSLKKEFTDRFKDMNPDIEGQKKKRKKAVLKELKVQQTVNAIVEIVKDDYLVLSIPEHNSAIGCASLNDYNTQKLPPRQYINGQSLTATVMALPSPATAGRLLLLLISIGEATETSSSKRAKKKSSYDVGALVQAEITEIKTLELKVKFGSGFHGRVYITEVNDGDSIGNPENIFKDFRVGQTLTAAIVSNINKFENNHKSHQWELSIKPSLLGDISHLESGLRYKLCGYASPSMRLFPMFESITSRFYASAESRDKLATEGFDFSVGQRVTGFVSKVDKEWVWLSISRHVKAQLYVLDSAREPTELQNFQQRYDVGKTISGYVLSTIKAKKLLRLVLSPLCSTTREILGHQTTDDKTTSLKDVALHIHEGDILGGRISRKLPGVGGMLIQLDPQLYGKVHYTEVTDLWESNPLSGFSEGQFVKCKVLEISHSAHGTLHVELSLRSLTHGALSQNPISDGNSNLTSDVYSLKRFESIDDLHPAMTVQGFVKNVTAKGCFIMLSRKLDARIILSNLSDSYTKSPEKEFPIGKLVVGKVLSVEPMSKRVEVTLKTVNGSARKTSVDGLTSPRVGDMVSGRIKRLEAYGLFITIDQTNLVGLCHISELSDDGVDNIETKYKAGEKVRAKVLKVDLERDRISLGMKESYMTDNYETETPSTLDPNHLIYANDDKEETLTDTMLENDSSAIQSSFIEYENQKLSVLADVEARASILPLEVPIDDLEDSPMDDVSEIEEHDDGAEIIEHRNTRREKKKAKEAKEQEIRAAEERLLKKETPKSADEFEKLVRNSPNSSFVWIKYMGYMLSLADVENARSIAERALKTINIREEAEKLNVWLAYFNLENEFGSPPKEAVLKIFHRALQYCDPKKVHLALVGMYERTKQHKLAGDLLIKMEKKFKHSCKVWLRRFQWLLKDSKDDGQSLVKSKDEVQSEVKTDVQSVLQRAVVCLPRHKHIKFLSQAAILEFKCGVPNRGRTMFEKMLREYPKRGDLWSIYLDQEIRLGDEDVIRALFERATSLSLPPKKMKSLLKKYLAYEKTLNDGERVEYVKTKAMEYVKTLG